MKKRIQGATIYRKIVFLIIFSSLVFFGLFFSIYYYTSLQEKEVYKKALGHFDNEVNSVLELDAQTNMSNIIDMVYWDEFVNYINTKDHHWFDENITSSVETYKADYLGIYDLDGKFISRAATKHLKTVDFIPKDVFEVLKKKRVMQFYVKLPEGYAQVFGATVHQTQDIYEKKGKPHGFFFIVKLLNEEYFSGLEKVNNSEIDFAANQPEAADTHIAVGKELKDWTGAAINSVVFRRPFDVSFHTTKSILWILIITYAINLLFYLIYARLWIHNPLNLITRLLDSGQERNMESLKGIPAEFKYIGNMFKENDDQKKLLEAAKAKAEESDRLKSSFLTNISHEIRTPMNAIAGFSNLLLGPDITEEERAEYTKIINRSGSNLISIIDDLIEMSRIDTNQIAPNYTDVDLNSLMAELYKTIKISIPDHKEIDFGIVKPVKPLAENIIIDEVKLKQVLTNLVTNAVKYTEKGFVAFGYEVNEDRSEIRFTIQDSGIGIEEDQQSKIFERFHRIENDYTIKAGGLGLGLAISKAYISMLGGSIWVESDENVGTTFTFTIPLQRSAEANTAIDNLMHAAKPEVTPVITILIAEDDNINFLLIQKMLNMNKHIIIRAKNGQEAVDICTENANIDLVLMDIKMPVMDGYQAFEIVKILRPSLPVIAQTAFSSSDDEIKIRKLGFHGYISKPIKKERLFEIIDEVMESKLKM